METRNTRKLSFVKLSFSSSQTVTVGERMLSFLFFFSPQFTSQTVGCRQYIEPRLLAKTVCPTTPIVYTVYNVDIIHLTMEWKISFLNFSMESKMESKIKVLASCSWKRFNTVC